MKLRTLVARSLRFHWRSHLGIVLGVAVGAAVLTGALVIGDSVRWSLRETAFARLGKTEVAMVAPDRFFRAALAAEMRPALGAPTAACLQLGGTAAREDARARINKVQVLGVDDGFWAMGGAQPLIGQDAQDEVAINVHAARRLGVRAGDGILVRVQKPSALPLDAPFSGEKDNLSIGLHVTVKAIAGDGDFGRFSLAADQVAPYNVYAPLGWLQKQVGLAGRANVMLVGADPGAEPPDIEKANSVLRHRWHLSDGQLNLVEAPGGGVMELRSDRVFIDPAVVEAIRNPAAHIYARGYLTYLVNELRVGDRTCPYSMVTGYGRLSENEPTPPEDPKMRLQGRSMSDAEAVVNSWLAEDLAARIGDNIDMTYYVLDPDGRLVTRTSRFRIADVVPIAGLAGDRTLMPDFPGVQESESERDWKPGFPLDLRKIRDADEQYWKDHRGTPKAFVRLEAGQRLWGNRFGNLTAIRMARGNLSEDAFRNMLRIAIDPGSLGLYFQPVRERALTASSQGTDFGQLFLGLSFFLVAAAVILTGLLFAFGVEQRAEETGMLLAVGFRPRRVRRLLLEEGLALAVAGGLVGVGCGLIYTRLMLVALATVWRSAVGAADLEFHAEPLTLAIGAAAGVVIAMAAIWLMVWRQARAPARELLASGADAELRIGPPRRGRAWLGAAIAIAALAGAGALVATLGSAKGEQGAGAFFGAGALLLIGGLGVCHAILARLARSATGRDLTLPGLAIRNATRRRGRSLATISLVACGAFLVIAVGANRKDALSDARLRTSGTGGFALVGESSLPILHDLNTPEGRKAFALPADIAARIKVVPVRVHEGDDASCLNLNRALRPRLLGVRPGDLSSRGSFTFAEALNCPPGMSPWNLLAARDAGGAIPAIGDATTITWSLGKNVGDRIDLTDARGRPMRLRLVGALAGSMLQGSLIISDDAFTDAFPGESGYRMILVDAAPADAAEVSRILSEQLSDVGLAVAPTVERLAEFNSVENTYLSIFQALGGLGLALGSVGLGVVVLRNVLERRGELALLRAVGFRGRRLERLLILEHWGLLAMGLASGILSALVAVMPAVRSAGGTLPYLSLGLTLAAVAAAGLAWTWLATAMAMRGPLLEALRNE